MIPEDVIIKIREEMGVDLHGSLNVYLQEFGGRLLKAVVDGELDEELGVVGRSKGSYLPGIGECETIALRPTSQGDRGGTGTGKEEE